MGRNGGNSYGPCRFHVCNKLTYKLTYSAHWACRFPVCNKLRTYGADAQPLGDNEACAKFVGTARGLTEGALAGNLVGAVGGVVFVPVHWWCCFRPRQVVLFASLSAGLMVAYCPHGICIAFTVLTRHEGPRHAFELIACRFPRAPGMIVYDNVSKVHKEWVLQQLTILCPLPPGSCSSGPDTSLPLPAPLQQRF